MNNINYLKDIFESIHDYKKIVFLIFLIQNNKDLLKEIGFNENDITLLNKEFENILMSQNDDLLSYIKNQEESIIEKVFLK